MTGNTTLDNPADTLPKTLAGFRDFHAGETIVVCGCGASLNKFRNPERFITIGVNDVGRLFDPTYLVVLNPRRQFRGDRFRYVENSQAKAVFTQLDLGLSHPNVVRFRLGQRGGADFSNPNVLHYTRNSPYLALCLAVHMGARRIGLIGVDFTDDHFFAKTGRHPLSAEIQAIDNEYKQLNEACMRIEVEVVNLSPTSRLTAFRHAEFQQWQLNVGGHASTSTDRRRITPGGRPMKIAIEKHKSGIVGDFMDALARTSSRLGHRVSRSVATSKRRKDTTCIVWNGRNHRSAGPTLYCEHGWLPRWEYQISPRGINADSHMAPFKWDGRVLEASQREELERRLEAIRSGGPGEFVYMQTAAPTVSNDLPRDFILAPLQMEWDTNIQRHVPRRFQSMQAFVDEVARANPPWPIIFKQHPADVRRGNRQLRLRMRRRQDTVREHKRGNIHQILKSGRCRGIVALNSNVVHDGLIWHVPAIVLGNGIWPNEGVGPFLTAFPNDWTELERLATDRQSRDCRAVYAWYLIENQWTLEDASRPELVTWILNGASEPRPSSRTAAQQNATKGKPLAGTRKTLPVVNFACMNRGWFFEDLKRHFVRAARSDVRVAVSDRPLAEADAWIFARTKEAADTPNPSRTIVQIHDMFDQNMYRAGGERACVGRCAAVVCTHPAQRTTLESSGIDLTGKSVVERPIGALEIFELRRALSERFTAAWVGRPARHFGREVKRPEWFVDAVASPHVKQNVHTVLLGERLDQVFRKLREKDVSCELITKGSATVNDYPRHYARFDCLVITSESEAGPLPLFEALACGVPVISTPVGWAPRLIAPGQNGFIVESIDGIAEALRTIRASREDWFNRRRTIRRSLQGFTLESWIEENLTLARRLALCELANATASTANTARPEPALQPSEGEC